MAVRTRSRVRLPRAGPLRARRAHASPRPRSGGRLAARCPRCAASACGRSRRWLSLLAWSATNSRIVAGAGRQDQPHECGLPGPLRARRRERRRIAVERVDRTERMRQGDFGDRSGSRFALVQELLPRTPIAQRDVDERRVLVPAGKLERRPELLADAAIGDGTNGVLHAPVRRCRGWSRTPRAASTSRPSLPHRRDRFRRRLRTLREGVIPPAGSRAAATLRMRAHRRSRRQATAPTTTSPPPPALANNARSVGRAHSLAMLAIVRSHLCFGGSSAPAHGGGRRAGRRAPRPRRVSPAGSSRPRP